MSDPISPDQDKHHNLTDWLTLHELDQDFCLQIINAIKSAAFDSSPRRTSADQPYQALTPDGAWTIAIDAMRAFLPHHHHIIEETFLNSEKIAVVKSQQSRRALTIDHGPTKYPTIVYGFRGDPSDALVIVHEFGHALQIRASEGNFIAPIVREVCAFLSEGALVSHSQLHHAELHEFLSERWRLDNQRYFGTLVKRLGLALANPNANYDYGWNYPIARFLALRMSMNFSPTAIWDVFSGRLSVLEIWRDLIA